MIVKPAMNHSGQIRQRTLSRDSPAPPESIDRTPEPRRHIDEIQSAQPGDVDATPKAAVPASSVQSHAPQSSAETPPEQLKTLIGQPAPEFEPQGWLFGEATNIEKLRGRWVVLYFWENVISGQDLRAWVVLQDRFGDQGLVVIIVKPGDSDSIDEAQAYFERVCHDSLNDRPMPFRVLVDKREPNVIPGTTLQTGGATHSAYHVPPARPDNRTGPLALLIGPDGIIRQQIDNRPNRSVIRELETVTGLKAGTLQWETSLLQEYSLPAGAVLRRIAPPYSQARQDYCFFRQGRTEATMTFEQRETLRESWMTGGTTGTLEFVLQSVIGLRSYELDDPDDLVSRKLFFTGDWCVRAGTPREELLRELERILESQLDWSVRFERTTVKQDVVVVTGNWKPTPLPGAKNESWIYLTVADVPDGNSGGGSSGSLDALFDWLGDSIRIRFVSEVTGPPADSIVWRDQLGGLRNEIRRATPAGEKAMIRLLQNVANQTGLSLRSEERSVEVWRIIVD